MSRERRKVIQGKLVTDLPLGDGTKQITEMPGMLSQADRIDTVLDRDLKALTRSIEHATKTLLNKREVRTEVEKVCEITENGIRITTRITAEGFGNEPRGLFGRLFG